MGISTQAVPMQAQAQGDITGKHAIRAQTQRAAIAEVWSRSCLARGERLQAGPTRKRSRNPDTKLVWQHPRAWTLKGTLREAFRALGMVCSSASGIRKTRREVDAISFVALAHRDYVDAQANCTWEYSKAGVLGRGTKVNLTFVKIYGFLIVQKGGGGHENL